MNRKRRKALSDLAEQFETLKGELESLLEAEEEYRDNMPENLQGSERYEKAEAACDNISSAVDSISEALDYLETAQE